MNLFLSVFLSLFSFAVPSKAQRATYFDTGPQVLTADGIALPIAKPANATGYTVQAVLSYDLSMIVENRTSQFVDWVETGGNFLAIVGGSYENVCYGALTPALEPFAYPYWFGHDTATVRYAGTAVMEQTYASPIESWTGEVCLLHQGSGVQGYMSDGVYMPADYQVPYQYGEMHVRLRGRVVWQYA